jgi:hypothetical protein
MAVLLLSHHLHTVLDQRRKRDVAPISRRCQMKSEHAGLWAGVCACALCMTVAGSKCHRDQAMRQRMCVMAELLSTLVRE